MLHPRRPPASTAARPSFFYQYVVPTLVALQFLGQPAAYDFFAHLNGQFNSKRGHTFLLVTSIVLFVLCIGVGRYAWKAGKINSKSLHAYDWLAGLNLIATVLQLLHTLPGSPMRI